jgi:TRAP-type C4-dicarboxylate transport system permease small subunit
MSFLNLANRSTADIIVLVLTVLVAVVLIVLIVGGVLARIIHPDIEMSKATDMATNIISAVVGALIGYVGGKAQGKLEANGLPPQDKTN